MKLDPEAQIKPLPSNKSEPIDKPSKFDLTPLVLAFALGFHSLFEGIALGVIKEFQTFTNLAIGVLIHRFVETISLAVNLANHNYSSWKYLISTLAIFGVTLPIGVGIGMAISDIPKLATSIIMAFAGGTFVYVACSEIVQGEFKKREKMILKMISFAFGSTVIICLWLLHDH